VAFGYSGPASLQLTMLHFGIAEPLYRSLQGAVWYSWDALLQLTGSGRLYCNFYCGSLVYRDCFAAAYSLPVWYSGTALVQLTIWHFGIGGPLYFQ
jgi:hypothetical protein